MYIVVRTPTEDYKSEEITDLTYEEILDLAENCKKMFSFNTEEGRVILKEDILKQAIIMVVK